LGGGGKGKNNERVIGLSPLSPPINSRFFSFFSWLSSQTPNLFGEGEVLSISNQPANTHQFILGRLLMFNGETKIPLGEWSGK
jgi:hypothetical protein